MGYTANLSIVLMQSKNSTIHTESEVEYIMIVQHNDINSLELLTHTIFAIWTIDAGQSAKDIAILNHPLCSTISIMLNDTMINKPSATLKLECRHVRTRHDIQEHWTRLICITDASDCGSSANKLSPFLDTATALIMGRSKALLHIEKILMQRNTQHQALSAATDAIDCGSNPAITIIYNRPSLIESDANWSSNGNDDPDLFRLVDVTQLLQATICCSGISILYTPYPPMLAVRQQIGAHRHSNITERQQSFHQSCVYPTIFIESCEALSPWELFHENLDFGARTRKMRGSDLASQYSYPYDTLEAWRQQSFPHPRVSSILNGLPCVGFYRRCRPWELW